MAKVALIGLGNPGPKYHNTPHNAGQMFINYLLKQPFLNNLTQLKTTKFCIIYKGTYQQLEFYLILPRTYMNNSGLCTKEIHRILKYMDFVVIAHDDLDIPFLKYKISPKTTRTHNGVNSVKQSLPPKPTTLFIRIGVKRQASPLKGCDYLLSPFSKEELQALHNAVFPKILQELPHKLQVQHSAKLPLK